MATQPTVQFDQALQRTIAAEPGIRNQMGTSDFTQMDRASRQLVAEHAASQVGSRALQQGAPRTRDNYGFIDTARQFIDQGRVTPQQRAMTAQQGGQMMQSPQQMGGQARQAGAQAGGLSTVDLLGAMTRYSQPAQSGLTYEQTLQNELSQQQSMIDSINARYAGLIDDARDQGGVQKNRARAIGNAAGALYSPRTEADYIAVDENTNAAVRALEAQKGAEIAAAMGQAKAGAFERYQLESQQALQRGESYVDNLLSLLGLQQDDQQSRASLALSEAGLTGRYGDAPTLDFLNYQRGLAGDEYDRMSGDRQFGLQQDQLQLQRDEFNRPNYDFIELADGSYGYFDAATGTVKKLGTALAPGSYGSSGGGSGYTGRYGGSTSSGGGLGYSGNEDEALLDYYNATGKYPADPKDIGTVQRIYDAGIDSFYGGGYSDQNGGLYGPPSPQDVLRYNPFTSGGATAAGMDFLSGITL